MSYPKIEQIMARWPSHSWEALPVTTIDEYELTLFHIWNEETRDSSKGPIMV